MLIVKILSLGTAERYALRRLVTAMGQELQAANPGWEMTILEINDADTIGRYAACLVMPTLVINEKVVCSGRFPTRDEIHTWLREAILITNETNPINHD